MKFFVWDASFEGGIAEIDEQHKRLVEMINDLHNAMLIGQGSEMLEQLLNQLIDYTKYHFETEERIYASHSYPNLLSHIDEHNALTEQVMVFQERFDEGLFKNAVKTNKFLKQWLTVHILEKDIEAMTYIKIK